MPKSAENANLGNKYPKEQKKGGKMDYSGTAYPKPVKKAKKPKKQSRGK
jgi:hypothetical protein